MSRLKVSQDLRPISDLKTRSVDVVAQATASGRPIVLTKRGRGVAVLLSVEAWEELERAAHGEEVRAAVEAAEREVAAGRTVEHARVKERLDRWSRGGR